MTRIPVYTDKKALDYSKILIWFPSGSSVEDDTERGLAHFTEHLLFKLRYDGEGIADFVEKLGGDANAYTSHDEIVVELSVVNDDVEQTITFMENIFRESLSSISEKDFTEEREVVLEELYMYADNPSEKLFTTIMEKGYGKHPYGYEIIGTEECLKNSTPEKIDFFFKTKIAHAPFVVISGGFDKEISFEMEVSNFKPSFNKEESTDKSPFSIKNNQGKNFMGSFWKIPETNGKIGAITKLMATILYDMDSAQFYNTIVHDKSIFDDLSVTSLNGILSTSFFIFGIFKKGDSSSKAKKIAEIWNNLKFTQTEVASAREIILSDIYFNSEGIGSKPYEIGKSVMLYNDPDKLSAESIYHILKISAEELNEFKDKYLSLDKMIIGASVTSKKEFTFDASLFDRKNKKNGKDNSKTKKGLGWKFRTCGKDDRPYLSLYALKKSGAFLDDPAKPGTLPLFIETLVDSAKGKNREETEALLDRFGITCSAIAGNNSGGFKLKVRDNFTEEAIDLFDKIIQNPIREEDFEKEKQFLLSSLALKEKDPGWELKTAIRKTLFAGTPLENPNSGTIKSVKDISFENILEMKEKFFKTSHFGIAIAGSYSQENIKKIKETFSKETSPLTIKNKFVPPALKDNRIYVKVSGRKQVYLAKSFYGPDVMSNAFDKTRVFESFLSGQKSPYFQLLREDKGLVYSCSVSNMAAINNGLTSFYAITSPEKAEEVIKRTEQLIEILKNGDFSESDFQESVNRTKFNHLQAIVKNEFHTFNTSLELALGIKNDSYLSFLSLVNELKKEDLVDFARKWFNNGVWFISES